MLGGEDPKETLKVAVGRNKPTRCVADQTVEGVRNAEDGRGRSWKTVLNDAASLEPPRGTANPMEGAVREHGGYERESSLKRREA